MLKNTIARKLNNTLDALQRQLHLSLNNSSFNELNSENSSSTIQNHSQATVGDNYHQIKRRNVPSIAHRSPSKVNKNANLDLKSHLKSTLCPHDSSDEDQMNIDDMDTIREEDDKGNSPKSNEVDYETLEDIPLPNVEDIKSKLPSGLAINDYGFICEKEKIDTLPCLLYF